MTDPLMQRIFLSPLLVAVLAAPAIAHTVDVTEDVAGTWHIEPDHSPKAGEPTQVWVALTRRGGAILPLAEATCQLGVYDVPRQPTANPLLQPSLEAIAAEGYEGIPGAEIVFPKTGLYELELDCTPKTAGDFQSFQMKYKVTVAEGTTVPSPTAPAASPAASPAPAQTNAQPNAQTNAQPNAQPSNWNVLTIAAAILLGIGAIAVLFRRGTKRR